MIDGTVTWVPVNAKLINNDQFEIIENPELTDIDTNELYEFLPGDIVQLENHVFQNGTSGKVTKKLISKGHWTDRNYMDFKFKATLGLLKIDKKNSSDISERNRTSKKGNINCTIFLSSYN